jgi:proline dehydrogenase
MNLFDRLAAAAMPLVPRSVVRRLSTRYIAGEQMDSALDVGQRLQKGGYRVTYDILGEAVDNQNGVRAMAEQYQQLLQALIAQNLERNFSLKPTQMGLNVSEDFCYETVAGLATQAKDAGAFIRYEMEDSPTVESTLRVFERLRKDFPDTVGCVLQSMLLRTVDDVRQMLKVDAPLNVRLVKGIYVEPKEVAWQGGADVNRSYLESLRLLLEGGAFVGVATHDEALIEGTRKILQDLPEASDRVEIQMLLGVREELRIDARKKGLAVRVYVPFGTEWYPYVTRRLRKNPKLARYAFKGLFGKKENL